MNFVDVDRWIARNLPGDALKDFYPRAMRRLAEHRLFAGDLIAESDYGFRMNVNRLDALKWCVHYFGTWEPGVTRVFANLIPVGGTVIDIGGNVGYNALLAAAVVGPTGRVVTFEPSAQTYAELQKNIALNGFNNVTAINAAVAADDGVATLFCMADNEMAQAALAWREGVVRIESVATVSVRTALASISLADIDLIKIDVEGAETDVIAGLLPILPGLKRDCVICVEASDAKATLAPLVAAGFSGSALDNDYSTRFYRGVTSPSMKPIADQQPAQDIVLCRNPERIERALNPLHNPA